MKIKIIKQLDDTITFDIYNSKGKKLDFQIINTEKETGISTTYELNGIRVIQMKDKITNGKTKTYI